MAGAAGERRIRVQELDFVAHFGTGSLNYSDARRALSVIGRISGLCRCLKGEISPPKVTWIGRVVGVGSPE